MMSKFKTVRFLRYYEWRGVNRKFHAGEVADISGFLADDLVKRGVAEWLTECLPAVAAEAQ